MNHFKIGFAFLLLMNFVLVQSLLANPLQDHIVSIQEVQKQVDSQSSQRTNNIQEIQKLLQHSEIQKHFGNLYDLQKIEVAVTNLDDKTLADLAEQSRLANDQLQAGVSNLTVILILVGVFFAIVLIVVATNSDLTH